MLLSVKLSVPEADVPIIAIADGLHGSPLESIAQSETYSVEFAGRDPPTELCVIVPMIGGTDYVQLMAWGSTSLTTLVANPGVQSYVEIIPVQTDLGN